MSIDFDVLMNDLVSGPAKKSKMSVDELCSSLGSLQNNLIKVDEASTKQGRKSNEVFTLQKAMLRGELKIKKEASELSAKAAVLDSKAKKEAKQGAMDAAKMQGEYNSSLASAVGTAGRVVAAYVAVAAAVAAISYAAYDSASNFQLMERRLTALSGGKTAGKEILAMVSKLSEVLPNTTTELATWSTQMVRLGVRDIPRLTEATKAAAAAFQLTGDEGSKAVIDMVGAIDRAAKIPGTGLSDVTGRIRAMGLTVEEVAEKFNLSGKSLRVQEYYLNAYGAMGGKTMVKLGNVIQETMIKRGIPAMEAAGQTWEVFSKKLKDNASQLFTGVTGTKGFQEFALGLQRIVRLLSGASSSGTSTKDALTGAFDVIFQVGARALEGLQIIILETQIAFLKLAIGAAPVVKPLIKAARAIDDLGVSAQMLNGAVFIFKALAISVGLFLIPVTIAAGVVVAFAAGILLLAAGISWLVGKIPDALGVLKDLAVRGASAGKDLVLGVAKGIKNAAGEVKDAVVGLANDAIKWFRGKDGIEAQSPSKKFFTLGHYTGEGAAKGIMASSDIAAKAAADMGADVVSAGARSATRGGGAGAGGGGVTVHVHEGAISISGAGDPRETANLTIEALVNVIERLVATQGRGAQA